VKGRSCANWQKDASLAVDESTCKQAHHQELLQETARNTVLTVDTSEVNELSKAKKRKTSGKPHTSCWTGDSGIPQHCDACTNMDSNIKPNGCTYAASPSDVEDMLAVMVDFPRAGVEEEEAEEGASVQHCAGRWYSSHDDLLYEDSLPDSVHVESTHAFIECVYETEMQENPSELCMEGRAPARELN
jgi:hypothetical protein